MLRLEFGVVPQPLDDGHPGATSCAVGTTPLAGVQRSRPGSRRAGFKTPTFSYKLVVSVSRLNLVYDGKVGAWNLPSPDGKVVSGTSHDWVVSR
jgi:hypothetical protein